MAKLCGIYGIRNKLINKIIYVGKSIHIHRRIKEHKNAIKKHKNLKYEILFNIGLENLEFEILDIIECDDPFYKNLILNEYESQYINKIEPTKTINSTNLNSCRPMNFKRIDLINRPEHYFLYDKYMKTIQDNINEINEVCEYYRLKELKKKQIQN